MMPFDPLAVPLRGTHLVEAGAGTGKTHGLTALVLRLVAEAGVPITAIALVTFTEAATRELTARVRMRLSLLARRLRGDGVEGDLQVDALATRIAADTEALGRVEHALAEIDDATIATIHGFCLRALRDFAFETGSSFAEVEPEEGGALRREALRDFWRRAVLSADAARAEWILGWCASPEALDQLLREAHGVAAARLVPTREDAGATAQAQAGVASALRTQGMALRHRIVAQWQLLQDSTSLNRPRDGDYTAANLHAAESVLEQWLSRGGAAPLRALSLLTGESIVACTNKRRGTPPVEVLPEVLQWAGVMLEAECARQWAQRAEFLHEALAAIREAAEAQSRTRGVMRFEDLIERLHHALHDTGEQAGRAAQRIALLRRRYQYAIVDEFQDTDAEQYAIFRALFHGRDDGALFLIGDPKQAIYRFRGGDVFAYRRAALDAAANRWSLRDNWRSDARLIEGVNALFDPQRAPGAFVHEFIAFQPAHYGAPRPADARPALVPDAHPLVVWTLASGERALSKESVQQQLLPAVVQAVVQLRSDPATRAASIAVLVPTNRDVENLVAVLSAAGLAVARSSEASVFATRQATELATLLRSLAEPRDARAARAALSTTVAGYCEAELRALTEDASQWDAALQRLSAWREIAMTLGPAALVRALAQHAGPRWMRHHDGSQRLVALTQLGELLQHEAAQLGGLGEQAAWLVRQAHAEPAPREAQLRPDGTQADVEVLTVHKSKGLEWDVVLLPLLWSGKDVSLREDAMNLSQRRPVAYHGADGELRVDLGSARWAEHAQIAAHERFAESVRLSYVALTRARHRILTFVAHANTAARSALAWLLRGAARAGDEAGLDDASLEAWLREWAASANGAVAMLPLPSRDSAIVLPRPQASPFALAAREFDTAIDRRFQVLSFSNLFGGQASGEQPDHDAAAAAAAPEAALQDALQDARSPGETADLFSGRAGLVASISEDSLAGEVRTSPRGAGFGECLHAVLQHFDPAVPDSASNATLVAASCRRFGYDASVHAIVREMVEDTFACELLPGVTLGGLPAPARHAELEFFFPLHEVQLESVRAALALQPRYRRDAREFAALRPRWHGLMHGYIDVVFAHDGGYGLIDYKSNVLGTRWADYDGDALAQAVRDSDYDLQYLIYSVALRRHLRARLGSRFDPQRHFLGAFYLFVRGLPGGTGLFVDRPPDMVLDALDRAFGGAAPA